MRRVIGLAIRAYRKTPLHHPVIAAPLARLLHLVQRRGNRPFVHDVGPFRMNIDLKEHIDSKIYYLGEWEGDVVQTIRKLVNPGDVAVDVGASIGYLTLVLAKQVGVTGRVFAFEASDWAYDRMQANVLLNQIDWVQPVRIALSDETREGVTMKLPCGYPLAGQITATSQCVDLVRLDDYFARNPINRLDFIKSDTDGMEGNVFREAFAIGTLKRFHPTIVFEVNPTDLRASNQSIDALLEPLAGLGYVFLRQGTLEPFTDIHQVAAKLPEKDSLNVVARWPGRS